ncbi:MAG: hypothetical protein C0483_16010 [Pirellula sp.]|nr:hypothetical protein [Pirellula sp.]
MNSSSFSRRRLLRNAGAVSCLAVAEPWRAVNGLLAADAPAPFLNRFPRMVQEAYVARVGDILRARHERVMALASRADAENYIAQARSKIERSFTLGGAGAWPERTPLNPRVTGVVERDTYRIEKVIFESRPEFYVTANLYVPKGLKGRVPGVVGSCGHSANGKAHEAYQSFSQGLARQGYVCLIFDPIGQGERLQYVDENLKARMGTGTSEHMLAGNQQSLVGEFFGAWRAWDGMRALDYLLSREEVDPKHVGITGNSGGGTMTTWLCGVERRWTMAAPSCFVTSFLRNLENELAADTEQCPPGVIAAGLDHGDFIACMAPRPVVLLTQEQDYFDVRGARQTFEEVRHLYKLLGAEENISLFTGPGGHGYAQDAREAMYSCFNKATGLGESPAKEPPLKLEEDAVLQCTVRGQVAEMRGRTVYSYTKLKAEQLATKRGELEPEVLKKRIESWLRPNARSNELDYRILRPRTVKGQPLPSVTTFLVQPMSAPDSENRPQIEMPTIVYRWYAAPNFSRPPKHDGPAMLYIAHDSSDAELRAPTQQNIFRSMKNAALYACDVRGLGDSRPNTCGENSYASFYGCDYFYSAYGLMLDEAVVRQRVQDVCTAIDFVHRHGGHREIHLVAKGYGAIPGAIAALLCAEVTQVSVINMLTSFGALAGTEVYKWPVSSMLPGVLERFDLPDLYRALEAKKINVIDPIGPGETVPG